MLIRKFKVSLNIWNDKRVPKETKYVYSYIYSKGYDKIITDINIGELQQTIKIKNKGLKRNLEKLFLFRYFS